MGQRDHTGVAGAHPLPEGAFFCGPANEEGSDPFSQVEPGANPFDISLLETAIEAAGGAPAFFANILQNSQGRMAAPVDDAGNITAATVAAVAAAASSSAAAAATNSDNAAASVTPGGGGGGGSGSVSNTPRNPAYPATGPATGTATGGTGQSSVPNGGNLGGDTFVNLQNAQQVLEGLQMQQQLQQQQLQQQQQLPAASPGQAAPQQQQQQPQQPPAAE